MRRIEPNRSSVELRWVDQQATASCHKGGRQNSRAAAQQRHGRREGPLAGFASCRNCSQGVFAKSAWVSAWMENYRVPLELSRVGRGFWLVE